jgi:hypothetical protein
MATLQAIYELRRQPVLIGAATAACMTAAENILNEDVNATNHANRILWANRNPEVNAQQIMPAIAMNGSVQTKWADRMAQNVEEWSRFDDGDIQFIVNSNIDRFATS